MSMEDFIITAYCLVDELLKNMLSSRDKLRHRFTPSRERQNHFCHVQLFRRLGTRQLKGQKNFVPRRDETITSGNIVFASKSICKFHYVIFR